MYEETATLRRLDGWPDYRAPVSLAARLPEGTVSESYAGLARTYCLGQSTVAPRRPAAISGQ